MRSRKQREETFTWICRLLAVAGFLYILIANQVETSPVGFYILLVGLFFGGDVIAGRIRFTGNGNGQKG
jgi:hypothetical protein